ncbi:MAG: hypothetical protein FWB82_07745 [Treponema sp.]|nr:hypothetical protein [Treponema sp.]
MRFVKIAFAVVIMGVFVFGNVQAREDGQSGGEGSSTAIVYTFFLNIAVEPFMFPLIGFVNIHRGNHTLPQIGFVNWNTGNFSTQQLGFVNTIGGDLNGAQAGFVNTAAGNTSGAQIGFVNTGASFSGAQVGFVNTAVRESRGLQLGFVNTAAEALSGTQIGFINFVDNIEDGIPIGFISIVRRGGFMAVEYSFSEFSIFNVGLKSGVERFYTTVFVSYNAVDEFATRHFALGVGIGTLIPITDLFFLSPELNNMSAFINGDNRQYLSFVPYFGFNLNNRFSIAIAPSVTWARGNDDSPLQSPSFSIAEHTIDRRNSIVFGARAALRFRFFMY